MNKKFNKGVLFYLVIFIATFTQTFAQTVTVGNVDAGPYGQGSSIAVPFSIASSAGCIQSTNVFTLYLSDASGSFGAQRSIGTFNGFYASFINGVLPAGVAAGTGYRIRIGTSSPVSFSAASAPFTIAAVPGVTAATSSQIINTANPDVFGACIGVDNAQYTFNNQSSVGATATVSFHNELDQGTDAPPVPLTTNTSFIAKAAHYTVTVKATGAGGIVGTRAYLLMNNVVNNNFGASGSTTVCLNGQNRLAYNVDVSSPNGIQRNYPGMTYRISWGDQAIDILTICDIVNNNGQISHRYTKSSCGNKVNNQINVFQVDLQPLSPYCGQVVTQVTGYAKVLAPPQNKLVKPVAACLNNSVIFYNVSAPGQDPNATTLECSNMNGLYTWLVDGVIVQSNYTLDKNLVYAFTTLGIHTVTLRLQNNNGTCTADDVTENICVQSPPAPSFTLPVTTICSASTLTPVNTSVIDNNCNATNTNLWEVSGPGTVGYTGGTNANSAQPNFLFSTPGIYSIKLTITTASCGAYSAPVQTVTVNSSPVATLAADASVCGQNITLNFNANPGVSRTILTGTQTTMPTTYLWTVNGGAFSYTGGTGPNSQYPQILFNDFATYTVGVTHTNNCGTATDSQQLIFQQAPVINAGADQTICEGNAATLAGSITGSVNSLQWVGGTGTFAPNRTTLNATYTPSAAEIAAGQAIVTLQAQTTVAAPCNVINDDIAITITRKDNITSVATRSVCTQQRFTYTITSANPISTYNWRTTLISGNATGFGATGSGATINDDIVNNSSTTDAVIQYTITPTTNGCPGNPFQMKLTVKPLPVLTATSSTPLICSNQTTGITFTSNVAGTTYLWTSNASPGLGGNTNPTKAVAAGSIDDVLVNNSTTDGTVTYNIIPYNGDCVGTQTTITITVKPLPVASNPGSDETLCDTTTLTLKGNDPSPGTGKWTLESGQLGVTFTDNTKPNAVAKGLKPGQIYKFRWTITASPTCPSSSNVVTITINKATVAGITGGAATVCSGSNAGIITLSGQVGNVLHWESSTDNGISWVVLPNSTVNQSYLNLTQSTWYRAIVQNGSCDIHASTVTKIFVNTPVVAANAGSDAKLCNATTITLDGNNPAPFAGVWTQVAGPPVTFVNAANPKTQVTGLLGGNKYRFVWTVKGLPPCTDSNDEVIIENAADVIASFTADKNAGCNQLTVNFTNTSSVTTATNFAWDFGDGTPVSNEVNPQHVFQPSADGKDAVYTVSLLIPDNCVLRPAQTMNITVRPAVPIANIIPDKLSGCGAFVLSVHNASPGNNALYDFYLYDNGNLVQKITKTDKTDALFAPVTSPVTKNYTLYMEVTDFCGTKVKSNDIPITISPADFVAQMFVKNNNTKGCAPFNVIFVNNSSGGDAFAYEIYDESGTLKETLVAGKSDYPYTFNTPGIYFVSIAANSDCATLKSDPKIRVEVSTLPVPDFGADVKTGCKKISVNFANLTARDGTTPPTSLAYEWDFGDGSAHSFSFNPPTHVYDFKNSPYTVTLKVTNLTTGCFNTIMKTNFIVIDSPPGTRFDARPGFTTSIPNYTFAFADETTGSNLATWLWTFGDGSSSASRNPTHTYADTGKYVVTLLVTNRLGCDSSISHTMQITGVPGQLYMPNAFMPSGSTTELKTFMAKGSGIASWRLQIYNNWGQLVFETNKLTSGGEPAEGWNGLFKGTDAPQGAYIWQASAKFINGTEWKGMSYNSSLPKRTGVINLIR
jgi:PKD repeat protein